jgi:hypothetical protein
MGRGPEASVALVATAAVMSGPGHRVQGPFPHMEILPFITVEMVGRSLFRVIALTLERYITPYPVRS